MFTDRIQRIAVGGSTAIHDGVLRGRDEVLGTWISRRLNRIVLLSDGQANVGPSRVEDFTRLGSALMVEGVSVSTIGLGLDYNEDLMLELARASDGNHAFARDPSDLINIFNREFNDVLASCAQTVSIDIELKTGVRAVRALSRDGTIAGAKAQFRMNQVYAGTEHYVLLEAGTRQGAGSGRRAGLGYRQGRLHAGQERRPADARYRHPRALQRVGRRRSRLAPTPRSGRRWSSRSRARGRARRSSCATRASSSRHGACSSRTRPRSTPTSRPVPSRRRASSQLGTQYNALGVQTAPASPSQMGYQRKLLRELDASGAGAATRY